MVFIPYKYKFDLYVRIMFTEDERSQNRLEFNSWNVHGWRYRWYLDRTDRPNFFWELMMSFKMRFTQKQNFKLISLRKDIFLFSKETIVMYIMLISWHDDKFCNLFLSTARAGEIKRKSFKMSWDINRTRNARTFQGIEGIDTIHNATSVLRIYWKCKTPWSEKSGTEMFL